MSEHVNMIWDENIRVRFRVPTRYVDIVMEWIDPEKLNVIGKNEGFAVFGETHKPNGYEILNNPILGFMKVLEPDD